VSGLCATTLLPLLLTASLDIPPLLRTFLTVFIGLVTMSQQTHAWSHSLPSETPAVVQLLQDAGLIISRKAHGAHHLPPFEGNYCIVSGICNPLLDGGLTKSWERKIFDMNGVAPRSWDTEGH
jgi:palmitoyl-[glycerolipid] 3-(E)-desaturase